MPNLGPILETEIEETAADMFLNWVYSTIGQGGFSNYDYPSAIATAVPTDVADAGDVRFAWMNCTFTRLFNLYQFWKQAGNFGFLPSFSCNRFSGLLASN